MKGFYILVLAAAALALLAYLALKETDSDIRRQHEMLMASVDAIESRLKDAMEPLTELRARKATNRLDKNYSPLTSRAATLRRKLNALQHAIATLDDQRRGAVTSELSGLQQEVEGLFAEVDRFLTRLDLIHWFVSESHPLKVNIDALARAVASLARQHAAEGRPLSADLQARVDAAEETAGRIERLSGEVLVFAWQDLEQSRALAEHAVSEMRKALPALETLHKDLGSG